MTFGAKAPSNAHRKVAGVLEVTSTELRIAFATPEYVTEDYYDGGLANYVHRVATALAGMGHDIHVLTLSGTDDAEFAHDGVTVHRIKSRRRWSRLDFSINVYRALKRIDSQQPLHLVQFPNYSCCGVVSMCRLRIPYVLRASSYQPALNDAAGVTRTLKVRMVEGLEALQFRLSRHVYAPSHTLQRTLTEEARLPHVRVIRTPFYLETLDWDTSVHDRFLKGKPYVLFFGRFQLHKGFHTLARALPRVLTRYPDACAALVGRDMASRLAPSMAGYARAQCGDAADRIVVLDKLPHRQLYPVIAGARLVVLPSLIENLPNAGLEAMALGRAVIGTRGTGFEELITDEETGFLVTPNNPDALAETMISAWSHPKREAIGAAARRKSLEFSPERTVEALLAYFREVMGAGT